MSKFTAFFKLVDADPTPTQIADNVSFDSVSMGNVNGWYSNIVTGSGNRIARYGEYDTMDTDVEVARALDTIAEEMTNGRGVEILQLEVIENSLTESEHITLNVAHERWIRLMKLHTKLFHIARNLIKYGDVVFTRGSPLAEWQHVSMKNVHGAYVDEANATNVLGLVINKSSKRVNKPQYASGIRNEDWEIQPIQRLVRFTLNSDMSDSAPFGTSILSTVFTAFRQKRLIEDSIIIYRVQRAPEKRVFTIDVGRMPPQRRKAYLEQVKLEMRQHKVPTFNGNEFTSSVDSVYDPQDMMEDFFIASGADGRGSKIEVLPGGQNLGELKDLDHFSNKLAEGLRVPIGWYRSDGQSAFTDGKVGAAYIQELRFSKFVKRLQAPIEETLDREFKNFLKSVGIRIDPNAFYVKLPEPSNFGAYRQAEKDGALLNVYGQVSEIPHMSPRFAMKRFMQMTDNEIQENERMRREELGLAIDDPDLIKKLYAAEGEGGGFGGGGGGFGSGGAGDFGLDDTEPPADEGGDGGGEPAGVGNTGGTETPDLKGDVPDRSI